MTNYNFDEHSISLVEKFIQIRNKGYYCSSNDVTDVYNKVFGKNVQNTQCSSCIRGRITELEKALTVYRKQNEVSTEPSESVSEAEPTTTKGEVKKRPINKTIKKKKGVIDG